LHQVECPNKRASIAHLSSKTNPALLSKRKNQMIIQKFKKIVFENKTREIKHG
jgi:hypothetical protein